MSQATGVTAVTALQGLGLGLVVVTVLVAVGALCLACANPWDPRLAGKATTYDRLLAAGDGWRHVLPYRRAEDGGVYPAVVKPDAYTSCALGVVRADTPADVAAALATLRAAECPAVVQQYTAGGIEARIYGVRWWSGEWAWDPLVYAAAPALRADVQRAPMADALRREVEDGVMASALPDMCAVALDVRAASLDALQAGEFKVLEVNGAFGVPHTWRGSSAGVLAIAGDLLRWVGPRLCLGAYNLVTGRVGNVWARIGREWEWMWTSNRVQRRLRATTTPPDEELI